MEKYNLIEDPLKTLPGRNCGLCGVKTCEELSKVISKTAYEGLVKYSRVDLQIGRRYYFQPRYCMLQWRHCGLVNTIGRTVDGRRVRIEGLWIG